MASESREFVNHLTNGILGGLDDELVDGDGFETSPHQFGDGGQGGRGGGRAKWCRELKISYVC